MNRFEELSKLNPIAANKLHEVAGCGESLKLLQILAQEVNKAHAIRNEDPSFRIRILVRILFSTADAICFHLKTLIRKYCEFNQVNFSNNENGIINKNGFVPFKDNLLVSLRCYSRIRQVDCTFFPTGDIPEFLKVGNDIRNRLTHPKQPKDYNISSEETIALNETSKWLGEVLKWTIKIEVDYIASIPEEIKGSVLGLLEEFKKLASPPK